MIPFLGPQEIVMPKSVHQSKRIIIIGAGMSGICMGMRLLRHGFESVEILERSDDVGGTWLQNHYPNSGCDIPSWLYSFSFAPNDKWSHKYARQPEILEYFRRCASESGLLKNIRFGVSVTRAVYDDECLLWRVATDDGQHRECDILISAVGQLNQPRIPQFEHSHLFDGDSWHSARWNHDIDLNGKRVAVIGNGASAIQFVPDVARQAERLFLFQRTPPWVDVVKNYRYPNWAKWLFRCVPGVAKVHRLCLFLECEIGILVFKEGSLVNRLCERRLRRILRTHVPPELLEQLTPTYPVGCKRILKSDGYLQALSEPNVQVVSEAVQDLNAEGVVSETQTVPVDAIIYGTGFEATNFLQPISIVGRGGQSIQDSWSDRPRTLLGMTTPGFPNCFLLYGPNTNLGHNSIIAMVESQVRYVTDLIQHMQQTGSKEIEVRSEAVDAFDRELQQKLASSVWAGDCSSWYKTADGAIPNNWWGAVFTYLRRTRHIDPSHYRFQGEG